MGTEKCPFCGQEIDSSAKRCFFCGAELNDISVHQRLEQLQKQDIQAAQRTHKPFLLKVIVILILAGVIFFYDTFDRKHTSKVDNSAQSSVVQLRAKVTFQGVQFIISNNDSFDWKNVKLEIMPDSMDERFRLSVPIIISGETYTADATKFLNNEGIRFNPNKKKPRKFWILCNTPTGRGGSYMADWK